MIEYPHQTSLFQGLRLLFILRGSVLPRLLPLAFTTGLMSWAFVSGWQPTSTPLKDIFTHPYAHQVFALSVGYGLVMRCNLAYNRYWEALGHVRIMFSKFSDAMAQCIAFDHLAEGDALLTADDFRRQLVHFCSLLSAVAMQSLQHEDNLDVLVEEPQAYGGRLYRTQLRARFGEARCDAKVEVLGGVSEAEKQLLKGDGDRAHTVNSWLIRCITVRQREGGVAVPPPILSRVYQELSNAMLGFNSAMKVAESPFPFPYAQLNVIQVWLLVATCPLIVAAFTESSNLSFVLTALTVMGFQGLTEVACDLESPFVSSANELPLNVMHDRFNRQLELLLTPAYISHNYSVLISESDESAEGMAGMAGASGDVPGMVHHSAVARRSYVAEQEAPKRVGGELAA